MKKFYGHYYGELVGWFDFQYQYSLAVNKAKDGAKFLEIGCANGKSAAYMAIEIINSGKKIDFITVDIFGDSGQEIRVANHLKQFDFVHVIKDNSFQFAENNNLLKFDFIWLDGDHSYETVIKELELFYPLLKEGGMIGGHDYLPETSHPGVKRAVDEFFKDNTIKINYISWLHTKLPPVKQIRITPEMIGL
jgi:cephalosporin hydroxylase